MMYSKRFLKMLQNDFCLLSVQVKIQISNESVTDIPSFMSIIITISISRISAVRIFNQLRHKEDLWYV